MASHFAHLLEISRDDYNDIFVSSDEEIGNEDSDIDVSEVEDESDENDDNGSDSEGEGDELVEWTDRWRNTQVDNFTSPVGITFELGDDSRK